MKVPPYKIDSFINSIANNKEILGALIYGPESGLVSINTTKIADLIVPNRSDPFLISNINTQRLKDDKSLIADEFVSISMLGGRKLIRIDNATNNITDCLHSIFCENEKSNKFIKPVGKNFILINAQNLEANSSLRKFAENNPYFACIACYEDNEMTIKNVILAKLRNYNLNAENGVVDIILNKFGKNRLIILNELEKLATYMGDNRLVTIDIMQNVIADISEISVNEFVDNFFSLNLEKSNYFLQKLFDEKTNSVTIIRFLTNYLMKIYTVKNNIEKGANLEQEIKAQRIFFKQEPVFKKHLNIWDLNSIKNLLLKLQELEIKCKSSSNIPELLLKSFNNFCFLKYKKMV